MCNIKNLLLPHFPVIHSNVCRKEKGGIQILVQRIMRQCVSSGRGRECSIFRSIVIYFPMPFILPLVCELILLPLVFAHITHKMYESL